MMRTTIASIPGLRNIALGLSKLGGMPSVAVGERRGRLTPIDPPNALKLGDHQADKPGEQP